MQRDCGPSAPQHSGVRVARELETPQDMAAETLDIAANQRLARFQLLELVRAAFLRCARRA